MESDLDALQGRPEFGDPSRYPCSVVGCIERAVGWVLRDSMVLFGLDYEVRAEDAHVHLCERHVAPARAPRT